MNELRDEINDVASITDPLERAQRAHQLVSDLSALSGEATRLRRESLEEVIQSRGMAQSEVAERLNVSRARVSQLLKSGPRPERAFLGFGELTVLVGGKQEANKANQPVISTDDLGGYELLSKTAGDLGLTTRYEVVSPSSLVNLNRDNLVVACGPRNSPLIEQVLMADHQLGFERDDEGWHLVDRTTGTIHRSPMDTGENVDFGYIGRLPRFDSGGTFLYAAGIHAPGVSGGLHYMVNHLSELYAEVKRERFSQLIRCEFDPQSRQILSSDAITPIYRPEVRQ